MGRWIKWMAEMANPSILIPLIVDLSKETIIPKVHKVAGILIKVRGTAKAILESAASNLCLLESLSMACGFEPPGLRSVVLDVIRNRDRVTTYIDPIIPELAR